LISSIDEMSLCIDLMKFFAECNEAVWDAAKNKVLCKFENGIFETDDPKIIEVLKKNYKFEEIKNEVKKIKEEIKEIKNEKKPRKKVSK
jgi:spermidine/putrescine-binding protein